MKRCKRCLREYDESDPAVYSPAQELGELFLDDDDPDGGKQLCPDCREEIGVLNLLGFGQ